MSRPINPIICDGCGKTKGESNAWWTAEIVAAVKGFRVVPGTMTQQTAPEASAIALYDLCGQECVFRFVSEQMGKQANG